MESPDFTPRNVAKYVVQAVIAFKTTKFTANTMANHTRFETDTTVVEIASSVVGWGIASQLKPVTDRTVDLLGDKIVAYRAQRAEKDTQTETTEKK